jgi:hypothetical protein
MVRLTTYHFRAIWSGERGVGNWKRESVRFESFISGVTEYVCSSDRSVFLVHAGAVMNRPAIRIPCSSTRRSQQIFAKLLTRVDPEAETGFGFEGTPIKPGQLVEWEELWPTPEHPRIPVVLECAGHPKPLNGHRRAQQPNTYVLWRFDLDREEWDAIARSESESWTWALDLRSVAARAIEESRGKEVQVFHGIEEVVLRVRRLLDTEIGQLPPSYRAKAFAVLHDEFYVRLCLEQPCPAGVRAALVDTPSLVL